jgi:RHS repeat-associated protein
MLKRSKRHSRQFRGHRSRAHSLIHYNDATSSTQFCFDRFGNLARKSQYIFAAMYTIADTAYDLMGRPLELSEPRGTVVNYTRDGLGRINGISYQLNGQSGTTTLISNVTYYPFGPVASITYGTGSNARTLTRSYDQDYVISSIADVATDGLNLGYSRDAIGNLTQITAGTAGNTYAYDALNRLTSVKDLINNPLDSYTYDGTGNRTSKTVGGVVQPYTYYPGSSHWLYNVGGTGGIYRSYDADGNTTAIGTNAFSFTYDDTGRMQSVKSNNVQVKAYAYDARGERVRKTRTGYSNEIQKTLFDEGGHILGDFDGSNNIIDEIIWMDDLPVGVLNGSSQVVNYIEPDHLGSPRVVIDPTRNLAVWKWAILNDPFGEFSPNGDADGDGTVYTLNLRFPGQEWDAESGLSYNYQRDYDSSTDRYIESDPLGIWGGVATYSYAKSSPLARVDKRGLASSLGGCPLVGEIFLLVLPPWLNVISTAWLCTYDCNTTCPGRAELYVTQYQIAFAPYHGCRPQIPRP